MKFVSTLVSWTARTRYQTNTRFFESLEEALANCPTDGYEAHDLVNSVARKNEIFRDRLLKSVDLELSEIKSLVPWIYIDTESSTRVIDFGGGGGYHYFIAKTALGRSKVLTWNVIETPSLVQAARKLQNSELSFYSIADNWTSKIDGPVDLVFTSGSLQYCHSPIESLKELIRLGAKYFYITRTPFSEGDEQLFAVQSSRLRDNGPGPLPDEFSDRKIEYPIVFESRFNIERLIEKEYRILLKIDEGVWDGLDKGIHTWGYLCERIV
jgi:putative methyltransferase (TIGR04325 family)